jgi:hypothetical protein
MRLIHLILAVVLACAFAEPAATQSVSFTLDLSATATQDVMLTVAAPTILPVKIIRSGGATSGDVTLDVSAFTNEQGLSKRFTISIEGVSGPESDHLQVPFADSVLPVNLHVPELPTGGKYTGRLILSVPPAQPVIWRFILTAANELRPATLVIDENAATLMAVRPWCLWPFDLCFGDGDMPVVMVHARDKTGNWPLDGVMARLQPGLKAPGPGFNFKQHISAKFDGDEVADIFAWPSTGTRHIDSHGQATISLTFKQLDAGEYVIPLRFTAMNSGEDDLQRLTVTVQVRNHLFGAILVLIIAALMSFMATRVVTMLRQRAAFLARIHALRPAWLGREPPILPVIWLRATLRQAEDLSTRYWLTGQSEIDTRLAGAAGMLAVLDRVRQVRERINAIPEATIKLRATWKLDNVLQRLPAASLTDQDVAHFKTDLDAFDSWCDPDITKRQASYWEDLRSAIKSRSSEVQVSSFRDEGGRKLADKWLTSLRTAMQRETMDLQKQIAAERVYARLSLLWEARSHPEWVKRIVDLHNGADNCPIENVYKVVDDGWWNLLNDDKKTRKSVEPPSASNLDPPEAYETVVFKLNVGGDPGLARSYLMQKKLTYRWKLDVFPPRPMWTRRRAEATSNEPLGSLEVVSTQPQIAQYSPRSGALKAKVTIAYEGREGTEAVQSEPIPISGSSDFGVLGAFERADAVGFFAVLIVSVISGVTIYALSPTFGSLKDYLALFTWGAGLDQGKNFIQSLAAYSSAAPTATAPIGAAAPATASPTSAATPTAVTTAAGGRATGI